MNDALSVRGNYKYLWIHFPPSYSLPYADYH